MNDANYEHLEWTVKEVEDMDGEAVFFKAQRIENMEDSQIKALFNAQRQADYLKLEEKIRNISSEENSQIELKKGLKKFMREFNSIKEIDFFSCNRAKKTETLLEALAKRLDNTLNDPKERAITKTLDTKNFKNKTWVTRKNPHIDRIASWWYIKRFIDDKAQLRFVAPSDYTVRSENDVFFDIKNGDFTHTGKMVTFEVIARSFNIVNSAINYIGTLVHNIDLTDDTQYIEAAEGIKTIINGIIALSKDDCETIEKGIMIFDAIYANYK
ncbi:Chromate resistance exported protein, partial [Candidatus Magnetoovum chiemensis]